MDETKNNKEKKHVTKSEIIFFVSFFIFILLSSILLLHNFEFLGHVPLTWGEIRKKMWKFVKVREIIELFRNVPVVTVVGQADIVNVVGVANGAVTFLLAHHKVDKFVVGTANDHSGPSGATVAGTPVVDELPFAFTTGGTIVEVDTGSV